MGMAACTALQHPSSYCCGQGRHPPLSPTLPGCTGKRCHVNPGLSQLHQAACIAEPRHEHPTVAECTHAADLKLIGKQNVTISEAGYLWPLGSWPSTVAWLASKWMHPACNAGGALHAVCSSMVELNVES
jgi:hypothetical protein